MIIDGNVFSKGQSVSATYGAGSGGCVVIRTFDLRGKGQISVDGGKCFTCVPLSFSFFIFKFIGTLAHQLERN